GGEGDDDRRRCRRNHERAGRAPARVVTMKQAFEPEFITALKAIFEERIVFNQVIGLKIVSMAPDEVVGAIEMRHELIGHYSHQRLHGGVISAGLDAMGGLAVMAAIGARHLDEPPL